MWNVQYTMIINTFMEYRKLQACINNNIHIYTYFFLSHWGLFYSILGKARIIACNLLILMSLPLFLCNNNGSICICGQVFVPQQYSTVLSYVKSQDFVSHAFISFNIHTFIVCYRFFSSNNIMLLIKLITILFRIFIFSLYYKNKKETSTFLISFDVL